MVAEARAPRRTRTPSVRSFTGWRIEVVGTARPLHAHTRRYVHDVMVASIEEVLERHASAGAGVASGEEVGRVTTST